MLNIFYRNNSNLLYNSIGFDGGNAMRITFEKDNHFVLIYIYLRQFDGKIVKTIADVMCELLVDKDNNWIGINILNKINDSSKFAIPPIVGTQDNGDIVIEQTNEKLSLLFSLNAEIQTKRKEVCNIDYNEDRFFGIELILNTFSYKTDIIKPFTEFRISW